MDQMEYRLHYPPINYVAGRWVRKLAMSGQSLSRMLLPALLLNKSMSGAALAPQTGVFSTTSNTNYIVTLSSQSQSNVIYSDSPSSSAGTIYSDTWVFVGEDWNDNDYNDLYFVLTGFPKVG